MAGLLRFDTIYKNKVNNTIYESESSGESECDQGDEFFYRSDLIKRKEYV